MNHTRRNYWATITARTAEPTGTPPSVDPESCAYSAELDELTDCPACLVQGGVQNKIPMRRISVGARVIPADVGDPCIISVRGSNVFLTVFEGIPFVEAC